MTASDFCDLSEPEPHCLHVAVGTLFSRDPAASLLLAGMSATLHALALRGAEPGDLAEELSRTLWQIAPDRTFASLFCARIDTVRRQIRFVNAGNEAALVMGRSCSPLYLGPNGPVLGLCRRGRYCIRAAKFEPGDTVLAVTEGAGDNVASLVRIGYAGSAADMAAGAVRSDNAEMDRTAIAIHFKSVRHFAAAA